MSAAAYDHPEISRRYFFPRPCTLLPDDAVHRRRRLPLDAQVAIDALWYCPQPGAPTLLLVHGNGECIADQLEHWPGWADVLGVNLYLVDYPGYAGSGGSPSLGACRLAGRAALADLVAQPPDAVPAIVVLGRSLGSLFALDAVAACSSARLVGLILESGVSDLRQRLRARVPYAELGLDEAVVEDAVARDFDQETKLGRVRCPVLVLHTVDDGLVPSWHAERLADWAGAHLFRLVLFEAGDHNSIQAVNAPAYLRHLRDLLARAARTPDSVGS